MSSVNFILSRLRDLLKGKICNYLSRTDFGWCAHTRLELRARDDDRERLIESNRRERVSSSQEVGIEMCFRFANLKKDFRERTIRERRTNRIY